jgi:hypothetical protein
MKSVLILVVLVVALAQFPSSITKATTEEVLAYWTPERMMHAKPLPLRIVKSDSPDQLFNITKTTGLVANAYTDFPYKTAGKMYFTTSSGSASCSATAIGGNLVLTAGHCVHPGSGGFYSNIIFVPQSKNGVAPIGNWVAAATWTTPEWASGGGNAFSRDVGIFKVTTRLGRTLEMGIGAKMTPVFNVGRSFNTMLLGYPTNVGGGTHMAYSSGMTSDGSAGMSPLNLKAPSTMTYGASGGGWLDLTLIKSVNSYITSSGGYIYGPYFDTHISDLIRTANG